MEHRVKGMRKKSVKTCVNLCPKEKSAQICVNLRPI